MVSKRGSNGECASPVGHRVHTQGARWRGACLSAPPLPTPRDIPESDVGDCHQQPWGNPARGGRSARETTANPYAPQTSSCRIKNAWDALRRSGPHRDRIETAPISETKTPRVDLARHAKKRWRKAPTGSGQWNVLAHGNLCARVSPRLSSAPPGVGELREPCRHMRKAPKLGSAWCIALLAVHHGRPHRMVLGPSLQSPKRSPRIAKRSADPSRLIHRQVRRRSRKHSPLRPTAPHAS